MNKPDGGSAFPSYCRPNADGTLTFVASNGMSLRDYLAAHERTYPPITKPSLWSPEELAEWRYRCADAMLAERDK